MARPSVLSIQARCDQACADAADLWASEANRLACAGLYPSWHLHYRRAEPGTHKDGTLQFFLTDGPDPLPAGWELATPAPFRGPSRDAARAFAHRVAGRLPFMSPDF